MIINAILLTIGLVGFSVFTPDDVGFSGAF